MKRESRHPIWSWVIHTPWVLAVLGILSVIIFFGSGAGNPLLSRLLLHRLEVTTGGKAELRGLSIQWLSLRATLKGLVIHGREPAGTEALFSAEEIQAGLRIDSFWGRRVSLSELLVKQPHVHMRVEKNGTTNIPAPPHSGSSRKPARDTLFDLHIRRLLLEDGWILYNEVKAPLSVRGGDLRVALDAGGTLDHPLYLGDLEWQSVQFTSRRYLPLPVSLSAKFTLWRQGFALEQGVLVAGRSRLDAQAEMNGFVKPQWNFRYRGWVDLLDFRETLREPMVPSGKVDLRGEGQFGGGQFKGSGSYSSENIALPYEDFHAAGIVTRSSFRIDNRGLELPDFFVAAFGGTVSGRVTMSLEGLQFRAATHVQNVRLAGVLPAIEHRDFPIEELRWDAVVSADTVETWHAAFRNFDISGKTLWEAPEKPADGHQPVTGAWKFRYRYDPNILSIDSGEFETPSSRGSIDGILAPHNSGLSLKFEIAALETYKDFINGLRGVRAGSPEAARPISGSARWDGKILGESSDPVFQGHLRGERLRYDGVLLDFLDGDLTYSPAELTLARGHARRGDMETNIEANLSLTRWNFLPENDWSAEANFEKVSIENLQQLLGWSYPVNGLLTGQLHGKGTRGEPSVTGLIDLADGKAYGLSFNRLRGQLNLVPDEVRIANAELRIFQPGKEGGSGAGIITGSAGYRYSDSTIFADLVGAALPLQNFEKLQSPRLPLGGQVTFRLKASGPMKAPQGEGTFRVVDFRVGQEVIGSFDGSLKSDGQTAHLELGSAMSTGEISGGSSLGLADPFPLSGKVSIRNINLDPFLLTAFHLAKSGGQAFADGDISVKGSLKQPESIVVDANFSKLVLNYASAEIQANATQRVNIRLENAGPVHLRSTKENLEIYPVTLQGTDTNLQIAGSVQFSGRRTLGLHLSGAVDLRLISGFVPQIDVRGSAQVNTSFEGTLDRPRITGRVHIENASARAVDFPTGLSSVKGEFVFDATRLYFENVSAEAGGGNLQVTGSVNYAETPLRYDVGVRTDRVRVRYPEGMSWLLGGSLRLTGTLGGGLLSGKLMIERVTLTQGLEVATILVSAKEGISGQPASSAFLRNLQFDVEALSAPDARMEWPGAELQAEANLRVRGTWEHPILLGHIHILSGELHFAGNRYRVTRGDLNFANPFRLDPVMNVEATTTIQQYEITLNFTGSASKLTLAYRSDPPLPANDIVTLLALGQTSSEATARSGGTTQSGTAGASAILSEAISSQLGGRLERLFGITRFRVDPGLAGVGSTGSEQNAAARVTVEQQIARNLTITYVSNVSSTQQQVIQVEYNVDRNVSIVGLRDQNGTFGIDIKIKKRFP
ncbi:MAG TPA: translocation/assembly module TamB domain-containing protein [Candidatus Udaeobacter sp.]|nr:translocation/assembly module TamB domain-containing protein [Candidatus Udaeobacter sp.]